LVRPCASTIGIIGSPSRSMFASQSLFYAGTLI
jgi:hypothetical protein